MTITSFCSICVLFVKRASIEAREFERDRVLALLDDEFAKQTHKPAAQLALGMLRSAIWPEGMVIASGK